MKRAVQRLQQRTSTTLPRTEVTVPGLDEVVLISIIAHEDNSIFQMSRCGNVSFGREETNEVNTA